MIENYIFALNTCPVDSSIDYFRHEAMSEKNKICIILMVGDGNCRHTVFLAFTAVSGSSSEESGTSI